MKKRILHVLFSLIEKLEAWRVKHDLCEVCGENPVETRCWEGCKKRICGECESFYYEDATICKECEAQITPEEKAEDQRLNAELETDTGECL
jgi:hypothetical protein